MKIKRHKINFVNGHSGQNQGKTHKRVKGITS